MDLGTGSLGPPGGHSSNGVEAPLPVPSLTANKHYTPASQGPASGTQEAPQVTMDVNSRDFPSPVVTMCPFTRESGFDLTGN